jgi:hypothetical protein
MKKLLFILLLLPIFATAQIPDSLELNEFEEFDASFDWDVIDDAFSYVDFDKDVANNSNVSFGVIGRSFSATFNAAYGVGRRSAKWNKNVALSINPFWGYYSVGYNGINNSKENVTQAFKLGYSTDFSGFNTITGAYSYIRKTDKLGTFGGSAYLLKNRYGSYEDYDFDLDEFLTMPGFDDYNASVLVMYNYNWDVTKRISLAPEIYFWHKAYTYNSLNKIWYQPEFNLDIYYGINSYIKFGKRYLLNIGLRRNSTIDKFDKYNGYKKQNPTIFMIGTDIFF